MTKNLPYAVAIDIGTSKISVLVARVHAKDKLEVIGTACVPHKGIAKGVITDLNHLTAAMKTAIEEAELSGSCRIHNAWISIPSTEIYLTYAESSVDVLSEHRVVSINDLKRVLESAKNRCIKDNYSIVNSITLGYVVDNNDTWIQYPRGMVANRLRGYFNFVMLPNQTIQNIERTLKYIDVKPNQMVISNLATAESCLLPDEKNYGVCLIDMGAGTTNITVYVEGRVVLMHTILSGGEHVTRDIAITFKTTTEEAERLKLAYGTLNLNSFTPDQMIQVNLVDGGTRVISRADLVEVIIARYTEILANIKTYLERELVMLTYLRHGIVLTGGAFQISDAVLFTHNQFVGVTSIHLSNPSVYVYSEDKDQQELLKTIPFNTVSGLLLFSQMQQKETNTESPQQSPSWKSKISGWWQGIEDFFNKRL